MLTHIRVRVARVFSRIVRAVAARFDTSLDNVIAGFLRLDRKLEDFIARRDAEVDRLMIAQSASFDREEAVKAAEAAERDRLNARAREQIDNIIRAGRIRDRIQALIGD